MTEPAKLVATAKLSMIRQITDPTGGLPGYPGAFLHACYAITRVGELLRLYTGRSSRLLPASGNAWHKHWILRQGTVEDANGIVALTSLPVQRISLWMRTAAGLEHETLRAELTPIPKVVNSPLGAQLRQDFLTDRLSCAEAARYYQINPQVWWRIPDVPLAERVNISARAALLLQACMWPHRSAAVAPDTLRVGPHDSTRGRAANERAARRRTVLPTFSLVLLPRQHQPDNGKVPGLQLHLEAGAWVPVNALILRPGETTVTLPSWRSTATRERLDQHTVYYTRDDVDQLFLEHAGDTDNKVLPLLT